jgi:hypothetical protein
VRNGELKSVETVQGTRYEIAVRGHLGRALSAMFEGMEVSSSTAEETCLVGDFQDQAALQGFLAQVGDLGLELSGVRRLGPDETPPNA